MIVIELSFSFANAARWVSEFMSMDRGSLPYPDKSNDLVGIQVYDRDIAIFVIYNKANIKFSIYCNILWLFAYRNCTYYFICQ